MFVVTRFVSFMVGIVIRGAYIHSIPGWHGGFGKFMDGMAIRESVISGD